MTHQNNTINRAIQVGLKGEQMHHKGGFIRGICLDLPHFDGDNLSGLIFKVTQYFDFHQTSVHKSY